MEAKELRIGNIVDYNGTYRGRGITEISHEFMRYLFDVSDEWDLLEPIPLTEEWLLKVGFEYIKDFDSYVKIVNTTTQIIVRRDDFVLCDIDIKLILKHVHQLQNLYFALTGEELTLKED